MSATFAPSPWPAPAAPVAGSPWRFGTEVPVGTGHGPNAVRWVLRRNCSVTPGQLVGFYCSLCVVAAVISAGFWWQGAPFVTAFAGLELLLVGVALVAYARHAADREVLTLAGCALAVEQHVGARVERAEFNAEWLAVEPAAGQGSLVELSARGRTVRVGRHLRPEARAAFAQELRRALRRVARPEIESETE